MGCRDKGRMASTEPIHLIERDRRRRRWIIRFSLLGLLLVALVGFVAALMMQSSSYTPDKLRATLEALPEYSSMQEIEHLLGHHHSWQAFDTPQQYTWRLHCQDLNALDIMEVTMRATEDRKLVYSRLHVTRLEGKDAWRYRWDQLLKLLRMK